MPQPAPIQIAIPTPCSNNWDEMTVAKHGRFCASCQKTVIDFTTWTDRELFDFFAHKPKHVCGRFFDHQLNHDIYQPTPPPNRLYKWAVALGLTLLFTHTPVAKAWCKPPLVENVCTSQFHEEQSDSTASIKGRVIDEKKEFVISASISTYQNHTLVGGAVTDIDGNYTIAGLQPGTYSIVVSYVGLDSITQTDIVITEATSILNFTMHTSSKGLKATLGFCIFTSPLMDSDNPSRKTFTRNQLNHMPIH